MSGDSFLYVPFSFVFNHYREMDLLSIPSNAGSLRLVQWPLFLLSSKVEFIMQYEILGMDFEDFYSLLGFHMLSDLVSFCSDLVGSRFGFGLQRYTG